MPRKRREILTPQLVVMLGLAALVVIGLLMLASESIPQLLKTQVTTTTVLRSDPNICVGTFEPPRGFIGCTRTAQANFGACLRRLPPRRPNEQIAAACIRLNPGVLACENQMIRAIQACQQTLRTCVANSAGNQPPAPVQPTATATPNQPTVSAQPTAPVASGEPTVTSSNYQSLF
jgi:hypothetical protein